MSDERRNGEVRGEQLIGREADGPALLRNATNTLERAGSSTPRLDAELLLAALLGTRVTTLRTAETEKYPHVTYFFNGGVETPYAGEERILVPSQKVATYDLAPEMSAPGITDVWGCSARRGTNRRTPDPSAPPCPSAPARSP